MSFRPALAAFAFVVVAAVGVLPADAGRHPLFPRFDDRGTLEWYTNLADAQAAAEASGRLIFLESGRLECPNCVHVVSKVIPSPALRARFAACAVGLAVDCDEDRPDARVEALLASVPNARMLPICGFATANLRWITGFSGFASEADVERHLSLAEQRLCFWKEKRAAAVRPCDPPRPALAAAPAPAPAPTVAPTPAPSVFPAIPAPAAPPPAATARVPAPVAPARVAPVRVAPAPETAAVRPPVPPAVPERPRPPAIASAPPAVSAKPPLTVMPDPAPPTRPALATPRATPPALAAVPRPTPVVPQPPSAGAPPARVASPPATAALPPPARIGEPARGSIAATPRTARATAPVAPPRGSAASGLAGQARRAAADGRWGEVLRMSEAAVGLPRDAEVIEMENLAARARNWSMESFQAAAEDASHDRFEKAMSTLASVRREMSGRVQEIDAERGERAVERLSAIVRGDPDVAVDCGLEARKAYAEFRGTRWASLFKAHLPVAGSCPTSSLPASSAAR